MIIGKVNDERGSWANKIVTCPKLGCVTLTMHLTLAILPKLLLTIKIGQIAYY